MLGIHFRVLYIIFIFYHYIFGFFLYHIILYTFLVEVLYLFNILMTEFNV